MLLTGIYENESHESDTSLRSLGTPLQKVVFLPILSLIFRKV